MRVIQKLLIPAIAMFAVESVVAADQPAAAATTPLVTLHISAQPMDRALRTFASQTGYQVMYYSSQLDDSWTTSVISGQFTAEEALKQLLAGVPLTYKFVNERAIVIRRTDGMKTSANEVEQIFPATPEQMRLARVEPSAVTAGEDKEKKGSSPSQMEEKQGDEESDITVTGTQIRGVAPVGSQVLSFAREDFDRVGAATVQQFMEKLPQNFGGGHSDDALTLPSQETKFDPSYGSGINLRGLGNAATLVLLDGRRLATGGRAEYTDVSMIPLGAVERIEVLTDGASAIYGSDAIGGVVNIITRSDYQAMETSLRASIAGEGDGQEAQVSQSGGLGWSSGSALLNLEYYRREPINALDRSFSAQDGAPYDMVPYQSRKSAIAAARQKIGGRVEMFGKLLYSTRTANFDSWNSLLAERRAVTSDVDAKSATLGADMQLSRSWSLSVDGVLGEEKTDLPLAQGPNGPVLNSTSATSTSDLETFNATATGSLLRLPAGQVKTAIGAMYQDQGFEFSSGARQVPRKAFNSTAIFAEAIVPILPAVNANASPKLSISLAGRYEDYSNFGHTFNPKFGVEWSAVPALKLRASYGTSFRAPSVFDIIEWNNVYQINTLAAINPLGPTLLLVGSNNPSLKEETAKTWNVGAVLSPIRDSDFTLSVNLFETRYKDRIAVPVTGAITTVLDRFREAGLAVRRGDIPSADFDALAQRYFNTNPGTWVGCTNLNVATNTCQAPVSTVNAIVDLRLTNLAETINRGVDVLLHHKVASQNGDFDISLNTTYLVDLKQRLTSTSPLVELSDTPYQPLKLRSQAALGWSYGSWGINANVDYADKYQNILVSPQVPVSSWTTVGINVRYSTAETKEWWSGMTLMFGVDNLFDRDPPYLSDPRISTSSPRVFFDQTNASPIGRDFQLTIRKRW